MAIYIDDKELVAAHQAGDGEAFEELVREYRAALFTHGRRKLYCDAAAEDAVQETLVRAYRALPKFNGEYRLGPWLHRIMANVCVDEANRRRRDGEKVEKVAAQPAAEFGAPSVEEELGLYFDDTDLNMALKELPDSYSEALKLRFVDELEYDQLAEIAGVSEQNARARVSRARVVMRAALKGVATLPVLLVGLLKRGEKVAAAATSASGAAAASNGSVATLAEASTVVAQVAPNAIPLVTKAAVSVGIAAAVFTPTTDSAVHNAVEQIKNGSAGIIVDTSVEVADVGSTFEVSESAEGLVISPRVEVERAFEAGSEELVIRDESINLQISQLTYTTAGPNRFELSGRLEITGPLGERSFELGEGSSLTVSDQTDPDGRYRIDALLISELEGVDNVEMRLAGFMETDGNEGRIAGLYGLSGEILEVEPKGSFAGMLVMTSESSNGVFALTLGS